MSEFRRRLMMSVDNKVPIPYITNGLIFDLDGIDKGGDSTAWIDLVGGVKFPLVTGVTFNTDHVIFASGHGEFKTTKSVVIPKSTGTLELVLTYPTSRLGIFYTGANNTISFVMLATNRFLMATGQGAKASIYIPTSARVSGKVSQYSVFSDSGKCNGITMETGSATYWSINKTYALIGNGTSGANYPFVGNLYAIRGYNRHLTDEERAFNLAVDNERFNLGLLL